jgi:hypothetical protein
VSWWGCEGGNLDAYLTAMTAGGPLAPADGLRILAGRDRDLGAASAHHVRLWCPCWSPMYVSAKDWYDLVVCFF